MTDRKGAGTPQRLILSRAEEGAMPIDYQRDDGRNLLTLTVRGDVTLADVLEITDRQVAEGLWTYRVLYDMRQRDKSLLSEADVRNLAMHIAILTEKHGARGRTAILSRAATDSLLNDRYRILVQQHVNLEIAVFTDVADAMTWLDAIAPTWSSEP
jgi:hypothetical protein